MRLLDAETAHVRHICRQVLHKSQLEDRKLLTSQVGQVDDMYESLAAHEQKVPTTDQIKHDDLTEALANFQNQLTDVSPYLYYIILAHLSLVYVRSG
jgi:hypothetical protein